MSSVLVETDFLLALAKPDDWLQSQARRALEAYDVHTSIATYAEFLVYAYDRGDDEYSVDLERAVTDLVQLVPVEPDVHERAVLTATVLAVEHDLTPFDAIHAGLAIETDESMLSSERDYDELEVRRVPLEPE